MKIPGVTNEGIFAAHKQAWQTFKDSIDKALEDGAEMANIDLTLPNTNSEKNMEFNLRLQLITHADKLTK